MSQTFRTLIPILLLMSLVSCKRDKVTLAGTAFNVAYSSGNLTTELTTKIGWTITSDQTWCTVTPTGGEGDANLQISFTENTTMETRVATLTITTEKGSSETITITQAASINRQFLCGKNWKLTAFTVDPAIPGIGTDFYPFINDCDKDNLSVFASTGTFLIDEGPTKCNSTDPQTASSGTWAFSVSETHLEINEAGYPPTDAMIILLDGTTLKMNIVDSIYTYTQTYIRQ